MTVIVSYQVDKDLYYASDVPHQTALVTTEYRYGNEILVRLQIDRNHGIRLNNLVRYGLNKDIILENEQYLFKKSYSKGKPKPITRSTFEDKIKRFDMTQTVTEQEILEVYAYENKTSRRDEINIVTTTKSGAMTAAIEFINAKQYKNFVCPAWLTEINL